MSPPFQQRSDRADVASLWSYVRIQRPCVGLWRAFGSVHQLSSRNVFSAAQFQVFWSLVPTAIRRTDARLTLLRPTIVLRSHLRSCKDLAGKRREPGRHARERNGPKCPLCSLGAPVTTPPPALLAACVTFDTATVNCTLGVWNHRCTCHSSVIKWIYLAWIQHAPQLFRSLQGGRRWWGGGGGQNKSNWFKHTPRNRWIRHAGLLLFTSLTVCPYFSGAALV